MCGIAGFWDPSLTPAASRSLLQRMCGVIEHRGPDDEGFLVEPPVGLGMRRLSIIDIAGGHQPVGNESHSIQVIFNGEIYNYRSLRDELSRFGHVFRTRSDTEVIAHAYEQWGGRCFNKLWGMFAIALWDGPSRTLVLARDRFGKKPLYYCQHGHALLFASEIKSLLQDDRLRREVDPLALDGYFTYGYVPGPASIFQGIRKMAPGSYVKYDGRDLVEHRYWMLRVGPTIDISEEDAVEQVRALLRDAVKVRLMSDVPLGAFLSGGVDSSAVVAYMADLMSEPVNTFTIGFEEEEFSEVEHARRIAKQFGTDHHEEIVRPDVIGVLPELIWAFDEPFADESMLPTYYVSRLARQHVSVALSGDGGDEAFGGYHRYLGALDRSPRNRTLSPPLSWLARSASAALPEGMRGKTRLHALSLEPEKRYIDSSAIFQQRTKPRLYTPQMQATLQRRDAYDVQLIRFAEVERLDLLSRMQYVDIGTYLVDDILVKVDRASMWTSLETRAPLLDHRLVELALSLPTSLLVRGTGKYILKRALRGILPDDVLDRRKMGFGVPLVHWMRGQLRLFVRDTLQDGSLAARGFVSQPYVDQLYALHLSGRANNSRRLWSLLVFELWCRTFIDRANGPLQRART